MTMTLEQVLDAMNTVTATSTDAENWQVVDWCSALSAHIAAMGEPVAWMNRDDLNDLRCGGPRKPVFGKSHLDIDVPLYVAPPASGDWDKVLEIIAEMRSGLQLPGENCSTTYVREWVDRLTAALPENANKIGDGGRSRPTLPPSRLHKEWQES